MSFFISLWRVSRGTLAGSVFTMKQWSGLGSFAPSVNSSLAGMLGNGSIAPVGMSVSSVTWWRLVETVTFVPSSVGPSPMLK